MAINKDLEEIWVGKEEDQAQEEHYNELEVKQSPQKPDDYPPSKEKKFPTPQFIDNIETEDTFVSKFAPKSFSLLSESTFGTKFQKIPNKDP